MNPKRTLRYYCLRIKNLKGDPHSVALGIAIGVFVGLTPTIPFHTAAILFIATVLGGSRLAGVLLGTAICNPLTIPLIYYASFHIGKYVMAYEISSPQTYSLISMFDTGRELLTAMLVGGFVLALPPAIVAYFVSLRAFRCIIARRKQRLSAHPGK